RKGDLGSDRARPGSDGTGRGSGNGQARYDSGLVSEAHREEVCWVEIPTKGRASQGRSGNRTLGRADGEGKSELGLRSDRNSRRWRIRLPPGCSAVLHIRGKALLAM